MFGPFAYYSTGYTPDEIPDLTGKTAIVTGGNSGIGYETCLNFAKNNCQVFMASRSKERAQEAINKIKVETGKDVHFLQLDLQDLNNVKSAASTFIEKKIPLDILINNAGIMASPYALTKDGIETQIGTNHVGHFLFTKLLLPTLNKTSARIVNVSSYAHTMHPKGGIDFEALEDPEKMKAMDTWIRYGQSKLANILFTKYLAKKLANQNVFVNCLHPGAVYTELINNGPVQTYGNGIMSMITPILTPIVGFGSWLVSLSPQQGAYTTLYCATSEEIASERITGEYFIPHAKRHNESLHANALDEELSVKLWDWTEKTIASKIDL
ncbi:hypothetical protein BC833DRAFT_525943 [Globomyces pollinis-pini]|nr:hypothetical protein BC833DRAFT_525943 [Globomyces pollinis-pini]